MWMMLACWKQVDSVGAEEVDVLSMLQAAGLEVKTADIAATVYRNAQVDGAISTTFTVVDLSMHSSKKRWWTLDMETGEVLYALHVAHGRNSDPDHDGWVNSVSNTPNSKQSSVGVYRTSSTYVGQHGLSLRLDGLEKGFNDHAKERLIVVHGADYATPQFIEKQGKAGRSFGCPAIDPEQITAVIETLGTGALLLVYYPEATWLTDSQFLDGALF